MTTKEIQTLICIAETRKRNLCCENIKYLFSDWENDVLSLNDSGYLVEFEVKISRSDFLADRKKTRFFHYDKQASIAYTPNRFYYAVPAGLVGRDELPWFAGLVYVGEKIEVVRAAPMMHKIRHNRNLILTKFCRVMQERMHLGKCALTIKNDEIKARNAARGKLNDADKKPICYDVPSLFECVSGLEK